MLRSSGEQVLVLDLIALDMDGIPPLFDQCESVAEVHAIPCAKLHTPFRGGLGGVNAFQELFKDPILPVLRVKVFLERIKWLTFVGRGHGGHGAFGLGGCCSLSGGQVFVSHTDYHYGIGKARGKARGQAIG